MRINEHQDHGHGARGAKLAKQLRNQYFQATDHEMDLLAYACEGHSDGQLTGDLSVLTCWDSDRLDLLRVGVTPHLKYLCTTVAKLPTNLQARMSVGADAGLNHVPDSR